MRARATTRRTLALIAAIGLGASACGRSCTCIEGEKTYETLDGKVKVTLVRTTKWEGGGRGPPAPVSRFALRVAATPEFDVSVPCDHVDMDEDDAGALIGWRCKGERTWNLIRIVGAKHFEDCLAREVGDGDHPDYAAAKPLVDVAARVALCGGFSADLIDVVRAERGAAGVGRLFGDTADDGGSYGSDPWSFHVTRVTPAERAEVERATCPALRDEGASAMRTIHAARLCAWDDAAARAALGRLRALPSSTYAPSDDLGQVAQWSALIALANRRKEAGALACAGDGAVAELGALRDAMIALGGAPCAGHAVDCSRARLCDAGACAQAELTAELEAWAKGATAEPGPSALRELAPAPPDDLAATAAAGLLGPLPRDILTQRGRGAYAMDSGDGPWCNDVEIEAGTPCACATMPTAPFALCALAPDGGFAVVDSCRLRVDDRARTIGAPTRACLALGEACYGGCCKPLVCRPSGSGRSVCTIEREGGAP